MKKILCILTAAILLVLASGCTTGSEELPATKSGQIALISDGAFIIDANNTLWTWGNNEDGYLGLGPEFTKVLEPTKLMEDVVKVCCSRYTYFLKKDGSVLKLNADNYSHNPDMQTPDITPVKILDGAVDIAVSSTGGIALRSNGEVWGWGSYDNSLIKQDTPDENLQPYLVMENAKSIQNYGNEYTIITTKDDLYCWGSSASLTLDTPEKKMSGVKKVQLGPTNYVLKRDNSLWGFGDNTYGQLGNGKAAQDYETVEELYIKKPIKISSGVKDFVSCFGTLYFIKNGNTLWGCGSNDFGQLGNGVEAYDANRFENKPILVDKDVTKVYKGSNAVYYCKGSTLWACGSNADGQLGIGTDLVELMNSFNPMLSTPQKVLNGEVLDLYTYNTHVVCLMKDGSIKLWGGDPLCFFTVYINGEKTPSSNPELFTGSLGKLVNIQHMTPAPETLPLPQGFAPRTE